MPKPHPKFGQTKYITCNNAVFPSSQTWNNNCHKLVSLALVLDFRRDVDDICALLGYYAASCGNCLPTFRDNVSVTSLRVKSSPGTLDPYAA
jgi:hypothetical protein